MPSEPFEKPPERPAVNRHNRDAVFTSEEAVNFEKGVVARYDAVDIARSTAEAACMPDVPESDERL